MTRPPSASLNLAAFQLRRVETPDWLPHASTVHSPLSAAAEAKLPSQRPAILAQIEATLRWALTDPQAIEQLQHSHLYSEDVLGDYCLGRELVWQIGDERFIIELETCLLWRHSGREVGIYKRYIAITDWNAVTSRGVRVLSRTAERESQLAALNIRQIGHPHLDDVLKDDEGKLSGPQRQSIERHWPQILAVAQAGAVEAIANGSSSGELDHSFFPARIAMTGEYFIAEISVLEPSESKDWSLMVMLHFQEHPFREDQTSFNYLGYDMEIWLDLTGHVQYETWGSSAI